MPTKSNWKEVATHATVFCLSTGVFLYGCFNPMHTRRGVLRGPFHKAVVMTFCLASAAISGRKLFVTLKKAKSYKRRGEYRTALDPDGAAILGPIIGDGSGFIELAIAPIDDLGDHECVLEVCCTVGGTALNPQEIVFSPAMQAEPVQFLIKNQAKWQAEAHICWKIPALESIEISIELTAGGKRGETEIPRDVKPTPAPRK